jgi:hypothetical protein
MRRRRILKMTRNILKYGVLLCICLFGASCFMGTFIKPKQEDIDQYIQAHPDMPELDKSCIYDGRFEIGMKQETVLFLLGQPNKIEIVKQPWAVQENWVYKKAGIKTFILEEKHVVGILKQ